MSATTVVQVVIVVMVVLVVTAAPAATAAEAVAVAVISRRLRNARGSEAAVFRTAVRRRRRWSSRTDSDDGNADRGHDGTCAHREKPVVMYTTTRARGDDCDTTVLVVVVPSD